MMESIELLISLMNNIRPRSDEQRRRHEGQADRRAERQQNVNLPATAARHRIDRYRHRQRTDQHCCNVPP